MCCGLRRSPRTRLSFLKLFIRYTPYVSQSEFGCILGQPILEITLAQRGFFSLHAERTYVTEFPPTSGQGIVDPYLSIF